MAEAARESIDWKQTSPAAVLGRMRLREGCAVRLCGARACTAPPPCVVTAEQRQASTTTPPLCPRPSRRCPTPQPWAVCPPSASTKKTIGRRARATRLGSSAAKQAVHGPPTAAAGRAGRGLGQRVRDGWGQVWAAVLDRKQQQTFSPRRQGILATCCRPARPSTVGTTCACHSARIRRRPARLTAPRVEPRSAAAP